MNETGTGLMGGEDISPAVYARFEELYRRLSAQVSFGVPVDINSLGTETGQTTANVRGTWVELTLASFSGTVAVTHNLSIPSTPLIGGVSTANRLNVRWFIVGLEYGSRTGAVAQPAAPGGFSLELLHMLSSAVTADSLTLQYSVTGFIPSATTPLYASLFVIPASR